MVKPEESKINDDNRFTREGSVDVSSKYAKQNYENPKCVSSLTDTDIADDSDQRAEESSCDEDDFKERSEGAVEREKKEEKVKTKLSAGQDFEENERAKRTKENLLYSILNYFKRINKSYMYGFLIAVVAVLGFYIGSNLYYSTSNNTINVKNNNENISLDTTRVDQFSKTIKKIKNNFPLQTDILWKSLFNRIKYVTESRPTRPAVMILLYNRNKEVADCLAWQVGKAASEFLNTPAVIELIGNSDMKETDNELVNQYRERLQKNGVMIVYRLDEIPGLVAQSFHTFCDTQNPLVKRAVMLFTLDRSRLRNVENNKPTRIASEVLRLLWNDTLKDFKLNSLITRLTDSVLEIHSEKKDFKCFK